MTYGHFYVAHVAWGANDTQTVRAFLEAESYHGPSLIIGYAHCIAHGIDVKNGLAQQGKAVASGHWPLFRFDPRLAARDRLCLRGDPLSRAEADGPRYRARARRRRAARHRHPLGALRIAGPPVR